VTIVVADYRVTIRRRSAVCEVHRSRRDRMSDRLVRRDLRWLGESCRWDRAWVRHCERHRQFLRSWAFRCADRVRPDCAIRRDRCVSEAGAW